MIPLLILAIMLTGAMAALAYTLATYALPAILAVAVARFAYAKGDGLFSGERTRLATLPVRKMLAGGEALPLARASTMAG